MFVEAISGVANGSLSLMTTVTREAIDAFKDIPIVHKK